MSPNDDGAAKSNEIGDALVTALGFEPTDGETLQQAEISEQMSDGFTVTDVLDRNDDDSDDDSALDEADVEDLDDLDDSDLESLEPDDGLDADDDIVQFDDDEDLNDSDGDSGASADDSVDDDKSVDPDSSSAVDEKADASISAVVESNGKTSGDSATGEGSDETATSSPSAADSDDADAVIDAAVDSPDKGSSSSVTNTADSTRGGFGRSSSPEGSRGEGSSSTSSKGPSSSSKKKKKSKNSKNSKGSTGSKGSKGSTGSTGTNRSGVEHPKSAFPEVESDPDVTLVPASGSPAITGEHDVVRVDSDQSTMVRTREAVESRGLVESVPSLGSITGWRPGGRRLQARKVRRVIRHIDPWSVLTFSVLFFLCLFAALLLASVLVWNVAEEAGTIENVENFILELGDYERFEINGEDIFRGAVAIMGVFTLAASVLVVLLTVMFNLLSDLLGGIRITVIEEETIRVRPRRRRLDASSDSVEQLE